MTIQLGEIVALLAAFSASVVALTGVTWSIRSVRESKRALDALRKADTNAAIASAELGTLGFNLYDRLGGTTLRAYVSDSEVREDFDEAFNSIRAYLRADSAALETNVSSERATPPLAREDIRGIDGSAVIEDTWTEVARARRDLEKELRAGLDTPESARWSGARLLSAAVENGQVDRQMANALTAALSIASRAIHGSDVSESEAKSAVKTITNFLVGRQEVNDAAAASPASPRQRRDVVPDGTGKWMIMSPGSSRASARVSSQREAIDRAREIVHNAGGGEIVIHGSNGQIRSKDTVRGRDVRSSQPPEEDRAT